MCAFPIMKFWRNLDGPPKQDISAKGRNHCLDLPPGGLPHEGGGWVGGGGGGGGGGNHDKTTSCNIKYIVK